MDGWVEGDGGWMCVCMGWVDGCHDPHGGSCSSPFTTFDPRLQLRPSDRVTFPPAGEEEDSPLI